MKHIVIDSFNINGNVPFDEVIGIFDDKADAVRAMNAMMDIHKLSKEKNRHIMHICSIPKKSKNVVKVPPKYDDVITTEVLIKHGLLRPA